MGVVQAQRVGRAAGVQVRFISDEAGRVDAFHERAHSGELRVGGRE